ASRPWGAPTGSGRMLGGVGIMGRENGMDEERIGAVVDAMYAMISGPAGPRDWSRQDDVFHPDCRQVRTGVDAEGRPWRQAFSPAGYRANADALLAEVDFFEVEIARE